MRSGRDELDAEEGLCAGHVPRRALFGGAAFIAAQLLLLLCMLVVTMMRVSAQNQRTLEALGRVEAALPKLEAKLVLQAATTESPAVVESPTPAPTLLDPELEQKIEELSRLLKRTIAELPQRQNQPAWPAVLNFAPEPVAPPNTARPAPADPGASRRTTPAPRARAQRATPEPGAAPPTQPTEGASAFDADAKAAFEQISKKNLWRSGESVSGGGSEEGATQSVRKCIGEWIAKYSIKRFVDLPCGDANWQGLIPGLENIQYYGFDISSNSVEVATQKNRNRQYMHFDTWDIGSSVPMQGDAFMMRDVVQHWPLAFGVQALRNAKASGSKYLLASTFPNSAGNMNILFGQFYEEDLQKEPFNFPQPLESCQNHDGFFSKDGSVMMLYDLQAWQGGEDVVDTRPKSQINIEAAMVFEVISREGRWGSLESASGIGSEKANTESARNCIGGFISEYHWTRIADMGAGDGNWQYLIPGLEATEYIGYDISTNNVEKAKIKNREREHMQWEVWDIGSSVPPEGDVIIMRDVLQTLPLAVGLQALENAKHSGTRYALISHFPHAFNNENKPFGEFFPINLEMEPFVMMQEPLHICQNHDGADWLRNDGSILGLYDLQAMKFGAGAQPLVPVAMAATAASAGEVASAFQQARSVTLDNTQTVRACLGSWISKYTLKRIVDIPCGDGTWQGSIPGLNHTQYFGFDGSQDLVRQAVVKNKDRVEFMKFDSWNVQFSVPMKADLVIVRDVLQYWGFEQGIKALKNVKASGAKYFASSSFPASARNVNALMSGFHKVNLELAPYKMPKPLEHCSPNHDGELSDDGSVFMLFDLAKWSA